MECAMPDDAVTADHSDNSEPLREKDVQEPEAPREIHVIDFAASERLIAELRNIWAANHSPSTRKTLTVLALYQFVSWPSWMEPGPPQLVLDLLPPNATKIYTEILRGLVAASVAWLRETETDGAGLEKLINARIEVRKPKFVLGFTGANAVRWFYNCGEGSAPRIMAQVFRSYRPDPSQPHARDAAIRRAAEIFDAVCLMNAWPLAQTRRSDK
jgi:hypothetical protein